MLLFRIQENSPNFVLVFALCPNPKKKTLKHFFLHWIDWDARFGTMSMIRCCFEPIELPEFFDTVIQKCTDPGCKLNKGSKHLLHNRPIAIAVDRHNNAVFVIIRFHRVFLFFWSYAIYVCVCCGCVRRVKSSSSYSSLIQSAYIYWFISMFRTLRSIRMYSRTCRYKYIIENRCNDRSKCQNSNFSQTLTLVIAQN